MPEVVLVGLAAGSILYDGVSQTAPFAATFGQPNVVVGTLLLAGFVGGLLALVLLVTRGLGLAAVGSGLLPIATGYLIAHYLTSLLIDGQRIVVALSDPFQRGWDLLGYAHLEPDGAWLPPALVWTVQIGAVVGGHIIGAWAGHRRAPSSRELRLRQLPLALLMVVLTSLTLWSLGQAVVREQEPPAALGHEAASPLQPARSTQAG